MKQILAIALAATLALAGCAAHVQHPGTANTFDSDSYDALLVTDAIIQQTKTDYLNGSIPAAQMPLVKVALNDLIAAYDTADIAYKAYHAAAASGTATAAQAAAVSSSLATVSQKTTALTTAKAGK